MRHSKTALSIAGATLFMLVGAGCSQGPGGGANEDTPESAAMEYRQALMHVMAYKRATLLGMSEGNIPADADVFAEYAADLAAVTGMLLDGFDGLEGSDTESLAGSGAFPAIWADWDDFAQRASDLESAAEQVADAAGGVGFSVGPDSAEPVRPVCGNCHRVYRQID